MGGAGAAPCAPAEHAPCPKAGTSFHPGPSVWAPFQLLQHPHLLSGDGPVDPCKLPFRSEVLFQQDVGSPGAGQRASSRTARTCPSHGSAWGVTFVSSVLSIIPHRRSGLCGGWLWPCVVAILHHSCFFPAEDPKGLPLPTWLTGFRARPPLSSAPRMLAPRPVAGGMEGTARAQPGPRCWAVPGPSTRSLDSQTQGLPSLGVRTWGSVAAVLVLACVAARPGWLWTAVLSPRLRAWAPSSASTCPACRTSWASSSSCA